MDHRDVPIWAAEAKKKYAREQKRACEATAWPNMETEDQRNYMTDLINQINGNDADEAAQWERSRAELAAEFGRKPK